MYHTPKHEITKIKRSALTQITEGDSVEFHKLEAGPAWFPSLRALGVLNKV